MNTNGAGWNRKYFNGSVEDGSLKTGKVLRSYKRFVPPAK
jgi:hypothetical protein